MPANQMMPWDVSLFPFGWDPIKESGNDSDVMTTRARGTTWQWQCTSGNDIMTRRTRRTRRRRRARRARRTRRTRRARRTRRRASRR